MPAYNPSQLHELVQERLPDNVNNDILAAHAREVLDAIIDSVYNLVTTPNPTAPSLDNVLLEGNESGPKDLLLTTGRYLVFKDLNDNVVQVRPAQPGVAVPSPINITLPLKPGVIALLSDIAASSWLQPVADEVAEPDGTEANGARYLVAPGATGPFAGKDGMVAERTDTGWAFHATSDGDMVRSLADSNGVIRSKEGGVWVSPQGPDDMNSLANVLSVGNTTGGEDIEVSPADAVAFRNNGYLMRLVGNDIAEDQEVVMPDASGTLATTQQVIALLATLGLKQVLVNGTETDGRSITVSEFDGINFAQGANMVRVKAPVTATGIRTLLLPDKSGTVATLDDVNAVALLVDGTMRAPEAFAPSGTYPTTYGGNPVQKGDTFRLGAGTMGTVEVNAEDLLIALVEVPGQADANWQVIESNRVTATQAEAEDSGSDDLAKLMPPKRWWQAWTKGLSLAAFGNAVRGTLLTGYAVGANAAIAAGDSVLAAFGKVQGQLAGKLGKSFNLSDVPDKSSARYNLGLGAMAIQNSAQALIDQELYDQPGHSFTRGDLVDHDGTEWVRAIDRVIGMVIESDGSKIRLLRKGLLSMPSLLTDAGVRYYLDRDNPGSFTDNPASGISVFVALPGGFLHFDPSIQYVTSGSLVMTRREESTFDKGVDGKHVTELDLSLPDAGVYHLTLWARTRIEAGGPARWASLLLKVSPGTISTVSTVQLDSLGTTQVMTSLTGGWLDTGTATEQDSSLLYVIEAQVVVPMSAQVSVHVATSDSSKPVYLMDGTRLNWQKIG